MKPHDRTHRWCQRSRVIVWLLVVCLMASPAVVEARDDDRLNENGAAEPLRSEREAEFRRMIEAIATANIFTAERHRGAPSPELEPEPEADPSEEEPSEPAPPPNPDAALVLVGVVIRGDERHVFVEDRRDGEVRRVTGAGAFGQGEIVRIDVDGVVYRVDGVESTVRVQQTFAGDDVGSLTRPTHDGPAGGGTSSSTSTEAQSDPRAAQRETILERLRQRRQRATSSNPPSPE